MKRYKFLLLAVVAALVTGCYGDDTNLDYKTLDLPAIDNPENDPALFIPNRAYKVKLHDRLQITPNVVYKDMNDLSYKWIIDGQLYSTTKDLDWLCEIETSRVSGVYEIHRNSAGNSQIYSFSIELDEPYLAGFSLLVEEQEQLRYDFISYTSGQPYNYTYNKNAAHDLFPFTGSNPRLKEYWSCEASNIIGEEMFLDDDPANCFSFDGHTLAPTLKLSQEFINDELPAGLRVKDFMHGGFVSYLLADDGRVFQRRGTRIYYTGRFMDLPMQYKGKQIKGVKLIGPRYAEQYGLIYDESEGSGRLLLVNFDYSTAEKYTPTRQGIISEFPDNSNLSNITDYELIDGWYVRNSNSMASGTDKGSSIVMLFRKKSDGQYYTREVRVTYATETSAVTAVTEVYEEVYRQLPDFGPDSKICVIRTDGQGASFMPPEGYIYYTSASDARKVLGKPRTSKNAPAEFHTFDSEVVSIDHETYTRRSCYLIFALADGTAMVYTTLGEHLSPTTNLATFEEQRVVATFQVDGKIRWAGCKYGNISAY